LAGAAGIAIENARLFEQVRLREATLTAMHEISTALRLGRADDETLQLVARHACDLVDADLATIVVPEPDSDSLLVHVAVGPLGAGMAGFAFPRETSVSGDVLQSGVAHVIDDARREPRYFQPPSDVGTVGPVVIIPLVSEGRPFGTLSVARSTGSKVFSGAEVDLMQSFAAQAGVVLELERGRQTIQRLDRLEDRERIARDLHDTVIQRLYATGLSLTGALRLIPEGTARQRVGSAIDELDTTIRQIRTVIFEVERPGDAAGVGVRSRVIDLAHEAGRALNFEPRVAFDGTVEASIGRTTAAEMLATLREALSNIARHAAAKSVDVEVAVTGDTLTLRVRDDGVGITAASARTGGHGIANMRSRAERLGGTMTFVSLPDEGTVLEWRVPI
jgi:signal transduction histidine kinase